MTWKERAAEILALDETIGRVKLWTQLKEEGFSIGTASIQRWLAANKQFAAPPKTAEEVTEVHRLERRVTQLAAEVQEKEEIIKQTTVLASIWNDLTAVDLRPPTWVAPKKSSPGQSVFTALLSDTHYDEVVDPNQIEGLNAYNRRIATMRTQKFFENTIELARDYVSNVAINGAVLMLGGDMVSGSIHDELVESNEAPMIPSCLYWAEQLAAGIKLMAAHFGRVHCVGVPGNHGRLTRKPRNKGRTEDNWDFLIYAMLAKEFKDCKEISFQLPSGADADIKIYETRYRLTHGDQFRGGSGIAGALSPLMLGDSRKKKRSQAARNPYDYLVMGHWHQYLDFKGIIAGPSLKGYDEYAYHNNFDFEDPAGAWWLTDSRKGRTIKGNVHVLSDKENWDLVTPSTAPGWVAGQ